MTYKYPALIVAALLLMQGCTYVEGGASYRSGKYHHPKHRVVVHHPAPPPVVYYRPAPPPPVYRRHPVHPVHPGKRVPPGHVRAYDRRGGSPGHYLPPDHRSRR